MNRAFNHGSQGDFFGSIDLDADNGSTGTSRAPEGTGEKIRNAAMDGKLDELKSLLDEWKGDPVINDPDVIGTTAVHTSASHGHAACLQLLIDYGANMNVKNHYGQSPMVHAANDEIREILTKHTPPDIDTA